MKKIILTLLLSPLLCLAQDQFRKVDLSEIYQMVSDSGNYPIQTLVKRHLNNDTTLTENEFFYLYYGYSSLSEYNGYASAKDEAKLKKLLEKDEEELREKDFKKVIELAEKVRNETPFDFENLMVLSYAYSKIGDAQSSRSVAYQLKGLVQAIMSTGDGKTEETALWVIRVDNEYVLLNFMDLKFGGSQSLTPGLCDRLSVKKNDQNIEAMYFNVSILFSKLNSILNKSKSDKK